MNNIHFKWGANPAIRAEILRLFDATEDNRIPRSEIIPRGKQWTITAMVMPETNLVTKPCAAAGGETIICFERIDA